jgi:ABC-type nitrate/sulfonate/bicarbonate transport system substrate-binding protein
MSKETKEIYYTICPLIVSSHIAEEKGLLREEFEKVGITPRYLRSLPKEEWLAHFTSIHPNLFRDGGCIPPIWARSQSPINRLIGITSFNPGGAQIVVRADSGIHRIAELKGRRVGLSQRLKKDRVDFARATAHRALLLALELGGLGEKDVSWVDIPEEDTKSGDPSWTQLAPANSSVELWGKGKLKGRPWKEGKALLEGQVDAVYARTDQFSPLERQGKVKVIENLDNYPDWTLQVLNTPTVATVSSELAEKYPKAPEAWLRASLKAIEWIKGHISEAAKILYEVTAYNDISVIENKLAKYDYTPDLSEQRLAGLKIQKDFLLKYGYIADDFDLEEWLDASFLERAAA